MAERTLVIVKPDGVQRHLAGQIISRFEGKGFKLVAAKFVQVNEDQAQKLYEVHEDKPFYKKLMKYLCSSPVMLTVWEAENVIMMARRVMGRTFGYEARAGTIRGDFGASRGYNLVHGSDSVASAEMEIKLFFKPEELIEYKLADERWLYGKND